MSVLSLSSYKHLFKKCESELVQLETCSKHPDYDYLLFNIIFGLNHLFEWFLKDKAVLDDHKRLCIDRFNPFTTKPTTGELSKYFNLVPNFPPLCSYQETVRKLCNNAKHFQKKGITESQTKNYTLSFGSKNAVWGNPKAICGAFDHYLYSVEIAGEDVDLHMLLKDLHRDWKSFFEEIETPCS